MSKSKIKENLKKQANTSNPKKKIIILSLLIVAVIAVLFILNIKNEDKPAVKNKNEKSATAYEFKKEGELSFVNADGRLLTKIDIEIAANEEERTQGLMYRDKMNENQGMLFVFDYETPQAFWMKNTLISLDIIFVNKENKIVKIHKNTNTLSEQSYPSGAPAVYVVEVNAGYCDKYGIKENDKIVWRRM